MACTARSLVALNSCAFPSSKTKRIPQTQWPQKMKWCSKNNFIVNANSNSSSAEDDCNEEECAPQKEVGSLSMDWVAKENTAVVGTYPPKKRGWTGYVESDTAGQTNIYSVEPSIYVAENAVSSGTPGSSPEGSENTAAITAGIGLIFVAAASVVLLQVGKVQTNVEAVPYTGPPLSYYINKFKPPQIVKASVPVPVETQNAPSTEASVQPEVASSS